jgi:hypothetical protein
MGYLKCVAQTRHITTVGRNVSYFGAWGIKSSKSIQLIVVSCMSELLTKTVLDGNDATVVKR